MPKKLSRLHRPEGMSLEAWQTTLRRQFGREQRFLLKNSGGHPIFSEFEVTNPESRNVYRVAIRGSEPGNKPSSRRSARSICITAPSVRCDSGHAPARRPR